jgi:hypothetical protein
MPANLANHLSPDVLRALGAGRLHAAALEALLPQGDVDLLHLERAEYAGNLVGAAVHVVVFVAATVWLLHWQGQGKGKG